MCEVANIFGVGVARHVNCIAETEEGQGSTTRVLHLALGPAIASWRLTNPPQRTSLKLAHKDIVTCLVASPASKLAVSTSYGGELAVWEYSGGCFGERLCSTCLSPPVPPMFASWSPSGTRLAVNCDIDGRISILSASRSEISVMAEAAGYFEFVVWLNEDTLLAVDKERVEPGTKGGARTYTLRRLRLLEGKGKGKGKEEGKGSSSMSVAARSTAAGATSPESTTTFSVEEEASKKFGPTTDTISVFMLTEVASLGGLVAVAANGRTLIAFHPLSLDELARLPVKGSGMIKSLTVLPSNSACLLVPSDNRDLITVDLNSLKEVKAVKAEYASGQVHFVGGWGDDGRVVVVNEGGLHSLVPGSEADLYRATDDQAFVLDMMAASTSVKERAAGTQVLDLLKLSSTASVAALHSLSCCGLDIHSSGTYLASGDFSGAVFVWRLSRGQALGEGEEAGEWKPHVSTRISMSVRSLAWRGDKLYIGDLEGCIWLWDPLDSPASGAGRPTLVAAMDGGITGLEWSTGREDGIDLLLAGTTNGYVGLWAAGLGEVFLRARLCWLAHPPIGGEQNLEFGSIGKFAEVWSVTWSPDASKIVSASEDQTTVVWTLKGERVQTLTGHTTAVTSVEWVVTPAGEFLATCADDQKVMVWKVDDWSLYHVFHTAEAVADWHTVTYLALEAGGSRLACGTETGDLFMWDILTKDTLLGTRMHFGSVEGLKWTGDLIASCASDCTVQVYRPLMGTPSSN